MRKFPFIRVQSAKGRLPFPPPPSFHSTLAAQASTGLQTRKFNIQSVNPPSPNKDFEDTHEIRLMTPHFSSLFGGMGGSGRTAGALHAADWTMVLILDVC